MHKKFAVTALLAAVVTVVTDVAAGTAHAAPPAPPVPVVQGVDHGVGYTLQPAEAGAALVAGVTGGAFTLGENREAVVLRNSAGTVVAAIPLVAGIADRRVGLAPTISPDGHRLTLRAVKPVMRRKDFRTSLDWWNFELGKAAPGAGIGALIGAAIGFIFLGIGWIPGALIGAAIGLVAAGGQDLIDAGNAYFGGKP